MVHGTHNSLSIKYPNIGPTNSRQVLRNFACSYANFAGVYFLTQAYSAFIGVSGKVGRVFFVNCLLLPK